ncbi:hypothetical protein ACROYT_G010781 [Oculina patagonica]
MLTLDDNNNYNVSWNFNASSDTLEFLVEVRATGWVGFGVAENAPTNMVGYDVAIGGVNAEGEYLQDYLTIGRERPRLDTQQDWMPLNISEENGVTTLKFFRKRNTTDQQNDTAIPVGMPIYVIWAFHSMSDNLVQHDGVVNTDNRGVRQVTLIPAVTSTTSMMMMMTTSMSMSTTIPTPDATATEVTAVAMSPSVSQQETAAPSSTPTPNLTPTTSSVMTPVSNSQQVTVTPTATAIIDPTPESPSIVTSVIESEQVTNTQVIAPTTTTSAPTSTVTASVVMPNPTTGLNVTLSFDNNQFMVMWYFDTKNDKIVIRLRVKTTGWVGFGFAENAPNNMQNYDVIVGGFDNGQGYLNDYYTQGRTQPQPDANQDYTLISASESGGYTELMFERPLDTGDSKDYKFVTGNQFHVIWAYGGNDITSSTNFVQHSQSTRGWSDKMTVPNILQVTLTPSINPTPSSPPPMAMTTANIPNPTTGFNVTLSFDNNQFMVMWYFDTKYDKIVIHLRVKTTGWVGFGFAENAPNNMQNYDVIVGGFDNGQGYLNDYYTQGRTQPQPDANQDYNLTSASESGGYTELMFERPLDTGDSKDYKFVAGNQFHVIWAYGGNDITSSTNFVQHSQNTRGWSDKMTVPNILQVTLTPSINPTPSSPPPMAMTTANIPNPTTGFNVTLSFDNNQFMVMWYFDTKYDKIVIHLRVKTTGWVGFGFAENAPNNMQNYDVIVGGFDNGQGYLNDYYTQGRTQPQPDANQDYTLKSASESGGYTELMFERPLDTGDSKDYKFVTGNQFHVIWAYGGNDITSSTNFVQHSQNTRGWSDKMTVPNILQVTLTPSINPTPSSSPPMAMTTANIPNPTTGFNVTLSFDNNQFMVMWYFDTKYDKIVIHLRVKTTGWVGFGFAENAPNNMQNYDVIVGGFDNGQGYLNDYYTQGRTQPQPDANQDYNLTSASESGGYTELMFERPLDTGDSKDYKFVTGNQFHVIWAYGGNDITSSTNFVQHSQNTRGWSDKMTVPNILQVTLTPSINPTPSSSPPMAMTTANIPNPTTGFNVTLSFDNNQFMVMWYFDTKYDKIVIHLRVNTTGWVGFGFAENAPNNMQNYDVIVGGFDNGQGYLNDYYTQGRTQPQPDANQDYNLTSASESGGYTELMFERPLDTGDSKDYKFVTGNQFHVIWAYGGNDITSSTNFVQHSQNTRGWSDKMTVPNILQVTLTPSINPTPSSSPPMAMTTANIPNPTTGFNVTLSFDNNQFMVMWYFDTKYDKIVIHLRVNTTGWVGFGFAENAPNNMQNYDVIVGGFDNGQGYLNDYYTQGRTQPQPDANQDYNLTSASESGGYTELMFERPLDTGDSKDYKFVAGNQFHVIWAYGGNDITSSTNFVQHSQITRGWSDKMTVPNILQVTLTPSINPTPSSSPPMAMTTANIPNPTTGFNVTLSFDNNQFMVMWYFDTKYDKIVIHLRVNTTGWVGFGFAENAPNNMQNYDVIVGGFDNGQGYLNDYYTQGRTQPQPDANQDYNLTSASESGGYTELMFERPLDTGDSKDYKFVAGNQFHVIWAYGGNDISSSTNFDQHSQITRGWSDKMTVPNILQVTLTPSINPTPSSSPPMAMTTANIPNPTTGFNVTLSFDNNQFMVMWYFDTKYDKIVIRLRVKTTGWVGFGFAENAPNNMQNYDVIVGGFDNGQGYLNDYYTQGRTQPQPDANQDYKLLSASESGGYTELMFERPRDTEDSKDYKFVAGNQFHVIWAYGGNDITSSTNFVRHSQNTRGWSDKMTVPNIPTPTPVTTQLPHSFNNNQFQFLWKFDDQKDKITYHLRVKTTGWVGFGFATTAPNNMQNYDVIVGGFKDGQGYLNDYYTQGRNQPQPDANQDYKLTSASESGGYTELKFERPRDTKDSNDIQFEAGEQVHIIWAYGDNDIRTDADFAKHSNKGSSDKSFVMVPEAPIPTQAAATSLHLSIYGTVIITIVFLVVSCYNHFP